MFVFVVLFFFFLQCRYTTRPAPFDPKYLPPEDALLVPRLQGNACESLTGLCSHLKAASSKDDQKRISNLVPESGLSYAFLFDGGEGKLEGSKGGLDEH